MPSHQNVLCGNRLTSLHDIFWVRNDEIPAAFEDLRERGRVAEHVGQPQVGRLAPELVEEEALAVHDLADQRLARRDIAVGLDPHAPDRLEPAGRDLLADPLVQRRVDLLHPRVLLRLRRGEPVLGIVVHEAERVGERPRALALRLADRPQPGGVDVRVPDRGRCGARRERAGTRSAGAQRGARRGDRTGDVVAARSRRTPTRARRRPRRAAPRRAARRGAARARACRNRAPPPSRRTTARSA